MSETFDSLKSLPRVPHAVGVGVQVGTGGNPPDRKYVAYGPAVDLSEAIANLKARRKGDKPSIPGGLDDEDEKLYNKPRALSPFAKMQVAQRGALTAEDVERLKNGAPEGAGAGEAQASAPRAAGDLGGREGFVVLSPSGTGLVDQRRGGFSSPSAQSEGDRLPDLGGPAGSQDQPATSQGPFYGAAAPSWSDAPAAEPRVVYVDRPVEKVVEVEKAVETEADRWLKRRVRVMISTPETTFSMSAVAVIHSPNAVTLIMPSSNDSMTFIPRTGARVTVQAHGEDPLDTMFTGASFEIPELGVLGLAFLVPKGGNP